MRRTVVLLGLVALVALPLSANAKGAAKAAKPAAKPMTVTGEVVDMGCYLGHGAMGEKHKECATKCLSAAMPAGLLTSKGDLYLLVMDHDKPDAYSAVRGMAAEQAEVTGVVSKGHGIMALSCTEVKAAAAAAPAK